MTKEFIASTLCVMCMANASAPYTMPTAVNELPTPEVINISISDRLPTRADIEAQREAERIEAERIAAEKAKAERVEKIADGKIMTVLATAYCGCSQCCGKSDCITASGTRATEGRTIAADTRILPIGTHVLIGGNEYIVEDTGSAIKGNRIDVFFDSHSDALKFGTRYLEIEVIG